MERLSINRVGMGDLEIEKRLKLVPKWDIQVLTSTWTLLE